MLLHFFPTFVVKNRLDSCSVYALLYYSQNTIICSTFIPVTTSKKLLIWMFVDQSSLIWPFNPIFTQCLIFVWSSVFSLNQCEPNIFVIYSNSPQCDTSYVFICLKTLINKLPSVWSYNDTCSSWLLCWNLWESWDRIYCQIWDFIIKWLKMQEHWVPQWTWKTQRYMQYTEYCNDEWVMGTCWTGNGQKGKIVYSISSGWNG